MVRKRFTLGFAVALALVVGSGHLTGDNEDEFPVAALQFTDTTYIQATPAAKPTCDATTLGTVLFEQDTDAAGAAGSYYVCRKDAGAATYGWVDALATGSGVSGTGTDNNVMRWDGTTAAQDSNVSIDDLGNMTLATTTDLLCGVDATCDIGASATEFGTIWVQTLDDSDGIVNLGSGTSLEGATNWNLRHGTGGAILSIRQTQARLEAADLACSAAGLCDIGASATEFGTVWARTIDDSDGVLNIGASLEFDDASPIVEFPTSLSFRPVSASSGYTFLLSTAEPLARFSGDVMIFAGKDFRPQTAGTSDVGQSTLEFGTVYTQALDDSDGSMSLLASLDFDDATYIASTPAALPTCDASALGKLIFSQDTDTAGGDSELWLCEKDDGTLTYSWIDVLAAGGGGPTTPGTTTDNAIVRWDGTGGTAIQNSSVVVSDTDAVTGMTYLTITGDHASGTPGLLVENTLPPGSGGEANIQLYQNDGTTPLATEAIGSIDFTGYDGVSAGTIGARILAVADGTYSTSNGATYMSLYTRGTVGSAAEAVRLEADGDLRLNSNDMTCAADAACSIGASGTEFSTVWTQTIDDGDGTVSVGANLVPAADNTHALGGANLGWDYLTLTDNAAVTPVTCDDTTEGTIYYKSDSNGSNLCLCMRTGGGATFAGTVILDVGGPGC